MLVAALIAALSVAAEPVAKAEPPGWRDLRWGMTQEEAAAALGGLDLRDISRGRLGPDESLVSVEGWSDEIADVPTFLYLSFWKGALYSATLNPKIKSDTSLRETWGWAVRVEALLRVKYGAPDTYSDWGEGTLGDIIDGKHTPFATWTRGGTAVALRVGGDSRRRQLHPSISYSEPKMKAEAIDASSRRAAEAAQSEASKL